MSDMLRELDNLTIREVAPESEHDAKVKFDAEELKNRQHDRELRKTFSYCIFCLICAYLFIVMALVCLHGFALVYLSDIVLTTLLGTTTATVISLFVIVAKYLFKK